MKSLIAIGGVLAVLIFYGVGSYYGAYNSGVDQENVIKAQYSNMENILAQYSLKVKEVAQVPGMMTDDLKEVITAGMTGRYGEDGSKAVFQWIKEAYPGKVDASLYKQIQQVMEAGRNKFENAQTQFIDGKRVYVTTLEKDLFLSDGWWMKIAGLPKIDLDDYKVISSGHAKKAFETGVDEAIQLR